MATILLNFSSKPTDPLVYIRFMMNDFISSDSQKLHMIPQ